MGWLVLGLIAPPQPREDKDGLCVHYGQACFSFEGRVASLVVRPRGILLCGNTPVWILNPEGRFPGVFGL